MLVMRNDDADAGTDVLVDADVDVDVHVDAGVDADVSVDAFRWWRTYVVEVVLSCTANQVISPWCSESFQV